MARQEFNVDAMLAEVRRVIAPVLDGRFAPPEAPDAAADRCVDLGDGLRDLAAEVDRTGFYMQWMDAGWEADLVNATLAEGGDG